MQRYFANCLVAIIVVLATCSTRTASGITVFDVLSNDGPIVDPETVIEPAGTLDVEERPVTLPAPRKTRRKAAFRLFLDVELDLNQERITLEEGDSFAVTCSVKSNPQAIVRWIRGHNLDEEIQQLTKKGVSSLLSDYTEHRLTNIEAKYVIDCATKKDTGPLHCVAIAGDKVKVQTRIITVVESNEASRKCSTERKPVITTQVISMFSYIGSTVWLPCEAEGVPRPKIQWVNENGTVIDNNYDPRYTVLPNGGLLIEKLAWEDMGETLCVAKSSNNHSDVARPFIYPVKRS